MEKKLTLLTLLVALCAILLAFGCSGSSSEKEPEVKGAKPDVVEAPAGTVPPGEQRASQRERDGG